MNAYPIMLNCYQCFNFTELWLFFFNYLYYPVSPVYLFILKNILCYESLKGNCLEHRSQFVGVNFPANGPVMQKKTQGWETSCQKMTSHDGTVKGDVTMFLKLEGGGLHRCEFKSTYRYVHIVGTNICELFILRF